MSDLTDSIIDYFTGATLAGSAATILKSYTPQFGMLEEEFDSASDRYFVITQSGGSANDLILEQPNYTLYFFGIEREGFMGFDDSVGEVAGAIIKYIKTNPFNDCYALIKEVSQPTGPSKTTGNRPFYTLTVRTLTRS